MDMTPVVISVLIFLACVAAAVPFFLRASEVVLPRLPSLSSRRGEVELPQRPNGRRRPGFLSALFLLIGSVLPWAYTPAMAGLTRRLGYAGTWHTAVEFQGLKALSTLGVFVTLLILHFEFKQITPVWIALGGAAGFIAPDLWLRARLARRNDAVLRLLPEVMDLLTLCVGAGLDFLSALNRIVTAKGARREPLIEELSLVLHEIRLGKRRGEALKTMAARIDLPEIRSFVRTLVQADRMGTPIGEALTIYASDVRDQRYNRAERAAMVAPIKILFPLIFCIMGCALIIIGGPIFIQFTHNNPFQGMTK